MKRIAQTIRLRPEHREEYRELHSAVWPGVEAALNRAQIRNYSIFHGDMDARVAAPAVLGHEMSGRIVRVGPGVEGPPWRPSSPRSTGSRRASSSTRSPASDPTSCRTAG
ncbi:L-rhamnose mutarotase [Streptomyces dysideae]|uniref:L-rhamnose mutarotase n=1 Tax=Streptomyces dysideae TaxID=909626 RepID=UPI000AAD1BF0|nr:L-rhamnose mutarotase [Streptomyces dysideae]